MSLSKAKFPSEVIFTKRLSGDMRRDERALFADITRTQWKSGDGNVIYFVRLEFRLMRGVDLKPMSVSVTTTQLDWITNCIETDISHMQIEAEREGKFLSFDKIENLFLSEIAISSWEQKAKFGIIFDAYEKDVLYKNHPIFSFIMKFQQTSGMRLKELIRWLYCSVLYSVLKDEIKEKCIGCEKSSKESSEHICKGEIKSLIDKFIGQAIEKMDLIKFKFNRFFDYFSKLLNISEENVIEAQNLLECISKAEKNDYSTVLQILFGNPIIDPVANAVINLIEFKEKETKEEEEEEEDNPANAVKKQKIN